MPLVGRELTPYQQRPWDVLVTQFVVVFFPLSHNFTLYSINLSLVSKGDFQLNYHHVLFKPSNACSNET